MNDYTILKLLGTGSYGCALLCKSKQKVTFHNENNNINDETCVIKQIPLNNNNAIRLASELRIMRKLADSHPNICKLQNFFIHQEVINNNTVTPSLHIHPNNNTKTNNKPTTCSYLCLVMDYYSRGDLSQQITHRKVSNCPYSETEILQILVQIGLGLHHLHRKSVIHRDLKPSNIFIAEDYILKIGDFGISCQLESEQFTNTRIGSPYYLSPEICTGKAYNKASDYWSLGCLLYELCTFSHPFIAKNLTNLIKVISTGKYKAITNEKYSTELIQIVNDCLQLNPNSRPSLQQILTRPILNKYIPKYMSLEQIKVEFDSNTVKLFIDNNSPNNTAHPENQSEKAKCMNFKTVKFNTNINVKPPLPTKLRTKTTNTNLNDKSVTNPKTTSTVDESITLAKCHTDPQNNTISQVIADFELEPSVQLESLRQYLEQKLNLETQLLPIYNHFSKQLNNPPSKTENNNSERQLAHLLNSNQLQYYDLIKKLVVWEIRLSEPNK